MATATVATMPTNKLGKIDVRAELEWVGRVQEAAKALGLSASAYIRMVVTQRMDQDGIPRPKPISKRPPKE